MDGGPLEYIVVVVVASSKEVGDCLACWARHTKYQSIRNLSSRFLSSKDAIMPMPCVHLLLHPSVPLLSPSLLHAMPHLPSNPLCSPANAHLLLHPILSHPISSYPTVPSSVLPPPPPTAHFCGLVHKFTTHLAVHTLAAVHGDSPQLSDGTVKQDEGRSLLKGGEAT